MGIRNYRDLKVWQRAMDLVSGIYEITKAFPREEMYGLTSQIRRAAVSVPSNIAEGQGRRSDREFSRFLSIAHGSLREMETQVLIAQRLGYLQDENADGMLGLSAEVGRLMNGLSKRLSAETRQ